MNSKTDKFVFKALDKMFSYVGFEKYDPEFTKQENWYTLKTWSNDQEEDFKKWFIKEYKKGFRATNQEAEKNWSWFNLMWGWKTSL